MKKELILLLFLSLAGCGNLKYTIRQDKQPEWSFDVISIGYTNYLNYKINKQSDRIEALESEIRYMKARMDINDAFKK